MELSVSEKELLHSTLASLEEAIECEYSDEEYFDIFNAIPESLWKDGYASMCIIKAIVNCKPYDWDIAVTEFIPAMFWEDTSNAIAAIKIILGSSRGDIYGYFPKHLWEDRDAALAMVSSDWRYLEYVKDEFRADEAFVSEAISSLITEIENIREEDPKAMIEPRTMLGGLINYIAPSLKSDKDFILGVLKVDLQFNDFYDEFDLIYNWIDPQLWSDKQFVMEAVENDCEALKYASKELMADEEFKNFVEDYE